ncbi:DNA-directed primase/polymerase protein [Channa argus]|uniref:DNA-directed primase/polymerase protein n=1 Tax=Channa argus TaxID=215402 RepID=A0A6G1PBP5_CHAAH|nr:DNA-directed primase/polymerase protein [Channa argus]
MKNWGDRLKKVEQLAQSFQLHPLATHYKPRLRQPSSVWKLFPRQSMAISCAQSSKEAVHVFALEKEKTPMGQRIYLVTSYSELWHYYRTYPQSLMHCYEVIPEGAVCKLYFDLEFHKPSNKGADGKAMVASLIEYVCYKLMAVYGIESSAKNVLNLDSSTEEKFSRHLIFNLQNAAFKDNIHVGVYTKNRNFRLYKSSKAGKKAVFTVADDNKFSAKAEKGISVEESTFLASLVCNVSFTGQRILTWDIPETKESKTSKPYCQEGSAPNSASLSGGLSSPHQEVDAFVLTVVKKDGIQGSIRRWNYFAAEQLLIYDIAKYRWCENVKRFHKSNNIMYVKIVVDLKDEMWYQKCHDPDCKNFRSSSYPLPQEICVSYILTLDEEDQAYLMDDAGNIEPSQAPQSTQEESADIWGDAQEDQDFLKSLDEFEQNSGELSDQLLLNCMAEFDSQ